MPNLSSFFSNSQLVNVTAGENIQVGDLVTLSSSDGKAYWTLDPSNTEGSSIASFRPFYYKTPDLSNNSLAGQASGANTPTTTLGNILYEVMAAPAPGTTTSRTRSDIISDFTLTADKNIAFVGVTQLRSIYNNYYSTSGNAAYLQILRAAPDKQFYSNLSSNTSFVLSEPIRLFSSNTFSDNSSISVCANNSAIFVAVSSIDTSSNTLYFAAYTNTGNLIYSNSTTNTGHIGWTYTCPTDGGGFLAVTVPYTGVAAANAGRMIVVNSTGAISISNTVNANVTTSFVNTSVTSRLTNHKLLSLANTQNFALVQGPFVSNATSSVQVNPSITSITANTSFLRVTNTTFLTLPNTNTTDLTRVFNAMDAVAGSANDVYVAAAMVIANSGANSTTVTPVTNGAAVIYHANLSSNTFYSTNSVAKAANTSAVTTSVGPGAPGSNIRLIRTEGNNFVISFNITSAGLQSQNQAVEMFTDNGTSMVANTYTYASFRPWGNTFTASAANSTSVGTLCDLAYDSYQKQIKIVLYTSYATQDTDSSALLTVLNSNSLKYIDSMSLQLTSNGFATRPTTPRFTIRNSTEIDTSNTSLYNPLANVIYTHIGSHVIAPGAWISGANYNGSRFNKNFFTIYGTGGTSGGGHLGQPAGALSILYPPPDYTNPINLRLVPLGVAVTNATAGNTVTVQIKGAANTRLTVSKPYYVNAASDFGQSMTIVGNTAIMNGLGTG